MLTCFNPFWNCNFCTELGKKGGKELCIYFSQEVSSKRIKQIKSTELGVWEFELKQGDFCGWNEGLWRGNCRRWSQSVLHWTAVWPLGVGKFLWLPFFVCNMGIKKEESRPEIWELAWYSQLGTGVLPVEIQKSQRASDRVIRRPSEGERGRTRPADSFVRCRQKDKSLCTIQNTCWREWLLLS